MATEQDIQRKILKYLESKHIYAVKVISASKAGVPDILCCFNGRFIAIEVKTPNTKHNTSELQKHNISKIIGSGGKALVAWELKQVEELIEGLENGTISAPREIL
jgi:Holliday junction resolvase